MRSERIVIEGERPPSWNEFYRGGHWSVRQAEAHRVHFMVRSEIDPETCEVFRSPVRVTVTAYFDRDAQDASNIAAKLYEDALIGWWLEDDDPDHVREVRTRSRLDPERPRVEIEVEEVRDGT